MDRLKFTIEEHPKAKKRPRFRREGNFVKTYDIQGKEKKDTKILIMKAIRDLDFMNRFSGPLRVEIYFFTPMPNSWSKKKQEKHIGLPDVTKPDLDNNCKFYFDVMNELIYDDDRQIVFLEASKIYSDKPRIEVDIQEL